MAVFCGSLLHDWDEELQVLETPVGMHVPHMCTTWITWTCASSCSGGTSGAQLCFLPSRPEPVKSLMEEGIKI